MLKKCEICRNHPSEGAKYQNKTYGPGVRVHNPQGGAQGDKNRDKKCRCTVCGTSREQ